MKYIPGLWIGLYCSIVLSHAQEGRTKDERTGIEIVFVAEQGMFPESWYKDDIQGKAISLNKKEIPRTIALLQKCLSKYPSDLLTKNLRKIYVVKKLEFFGVRYGGTNSSDIVYISNQGIEKGYNDIFIEQIFHAEFSSILWRNYSSDFREEEWLKNSKTSYGNGGVEALKTGSSSELFQKEIHRKGFLNQYAMSSVENDFNAFAKNIFKAKNSFWSITQAHEGLKNKLQLIINFYHNLNKQFTQGYFHKISLE